MPLFQLFTNLPKSAIPKDALDTIAKIVSETTGKPKELIFVHVIPDQMMSFAGSDKPILFCSLTAIKQLNPDANKKFSASLAQKLEGMFGVAKDRIFVKFDDRTPAFLGYSGTTMDTIL